MKNCILIVDDDPNELRAMELVLKEIGVDVCCADSAAKARILMDKIKPDLILTDVMMPVENGFEFCRQLKNSDSTKEIPVIFLTGLEKTENIVKGFGVGGDDYLLKPISIQDLHVRVKNHLKTINLQTSLKARNNELQKAEDALKESAERYKGLFMNMGSGVAIYEVKGDAEDFIFKDFNKAAEKIDKQRKEELIGRSIFEARPQVKEFGLIDVFREVWKTGKPKHHPIALYQDKKLNLWYENFVYKLPSGEIVTIFTNETERKQAENAIKEGEAFLGTLIDAIPVPVFYKNRAGQYLGFNKAFESFFGKTKEHLIGKSVFDINPKDLAEIYHAKDKELFEKDGKQQYESQVKNTNGELRNVIFNKSVYTDNQGSVVGLIGAILDITDRKLAEEEREKLRNQLAQAWKMESIGTLTSGIAHDFNNIMGIILGNTELALEDVPESNRAYSNLEKIKTASRRAANIVKQLSNLSRITDQKLQPIEIATVIKDALKLLRSTIPKTIDIQQDIQITNETILADPIQMNQIIINLCINASQAMEQTSGNLTITVEKVILDDVSAKNYPDLRIGKYIKVMVMDTGPGIDPKIIDRIFDPYFTTKGVGKGSGMGLAVVHSIVKSHSGAIKVDSTLGKGTQFCILFPLAQGKAVVEVETIQEIPRGKETILFVDDEISIVNMVQRMFERLGYKVETAITPQDALDRFALNPDHFNLVITDMTMPQMTGVKLSEKLMAIRPDIPIIICTGYSALVDEEKAKELGLAAYVMKPINIREIAQTIRKVLDRK